MERERKRKEAEERALREAEEVKNNVCQMMRWFKPNGSKSIDCSKPFSRFLSNPYVKLTNCQYSRQFKRKEQLRMETSRIPSVFFWALEQNLSHFSLFQKCCFIESFLQASLINRSIAKKKMSIIRWLDFCKSSGSSFPLFQYCYKYHVETINPQWKY